MTTDHTTLAAAETHLQAAGDQLDAARDPLCGDQNLAVLRAQAHAQLAIGASLINITALLSIITSRMSK